MYNLERFKKLPSNLQKVLQEAAVDAENETMAFKEKLIADSEAEIKAAGVKFVTFPLEEAKKYVGLWFESNWPVVIEADPVFCPRMKEVWEKNYKP